ncbi:MAG: chromosome segregation protein SMC [Candidatus Omnitrophica bacterium]|nr:chromosome segregation protein SMC [Candidatus Omnitrophota bacterium]
MRLKKLEVFGFKSFADKTEIIFDQGVTCIVGPNGCGKSNISDSIRWVLGERSAKLLRGSKMEDVIFSGTDFRKSVAFAEVSLTIDNTDRGLPIDYQEVTITRRLYRSGESEYLINKTLCRLKDIQDLILDTGIGSSSYSMIEQGRIDYILNADADERRFLIEEAAGISKYKVKKEEAIRKLERTEENLLRLKDIVHEVERNIQYAERQARRAERYKEQLEKLKDLEIRKAFYDLNNLGQQKLDQEKQLEVLKTKILAIEEGLSNIQSGHQEATRALREISDRQSSAEGQRYELRSQLDQNKQQLRFNQEKRKTLHVRQGEITQEKVNLEEQLQKNQLEADEKRNELASIEKERQGSGENLKLEEARLLSLEGDIQKIRQLLEATKAEVFETAASLSKVRNELHRMAAFLETTEEHQKKQEAGVLRFQREIQGWTEKEQRYIQEINNFSKKAADLQQEKTFCENQSSETNKKLEKLSEEITQLERLLHEKETRLNMLKEIDRASGTDIEHLLQQSQSLGHNLVRAMREIFTVQEGYELALESCLGAYAQSLIVNDLETAKHLFSLLEKQSSSVGLLIRDASQKGTPKAENMPSHSKIKKTLRNVAAIKPEYKDLLDPFLDQVFLLDDIDADDFATILPMAQKNTFISKNGWVFGPQGRIFYSSGKNSSETNTFKRGAEINSLKDEIVQSKQKKSGVESERESLRQSFVQIKSRIPEIEAAQMDAAIQRESFESMSRGVKDRLVSYEREIELLAIENQDVDQQRQHTVEERTRLELELRKFEEADRSIRLQQENFFQELEAFGQKKDEALQRISSYKTRLESMKERGILIEDTLSLLEAHQQRSKDRQQFLNAEDARILETEQQLAQHDEEIGTQTLQFEDSLRIVDVSLELIRQERAEIDARLTKLQESLQDLSQQKQVVNEKSHALEMSTMDLTYKEKNIYERLEQTYRLDLKQLSAESYALGEDLTLESLNQQIDALRQKVEGLGTVNLLAIEEYDELKQRYDFLSTQKKDLEDSRESLLEAIRKINRTTKGLFEETFTKVQETFKEYYQILFRGGEARLILVDETNPLESGIDIVVRPPGKKLTHITLLSGGEKALTAIALLFSLFKIKPSPFCVLDEVDAPLDEANIDRFLTVLRTFLELSQFIIVTHNRKTIAMGDSLFGVTMQEAGVSRLVSVKVNPNTPLPDYLQNKPTENRNPQSDTVTA